MNHTQHLLIKLAEEASEVAQIALKTAAFGMDEKQAGQDLTNKERIHAELNDLAGIIAMLNAEHGFEFEPDSKAILARYERVVKWRTYSESLGLVAPAEVQL